MLPLLPPRVLHRHKSNRRSCTRIATFNCRTLFDDHRVTELDTALTKKGIDICALQETRRIGFNVTPSKNFLIYTFGEREGHYGVGFAINKRFEHLITAARATSESQGRFIRIDLRMHDEKQSVTLLNCYSPPNSSPASARKKFYTQLDKLVTPKTWLFGDFNARIGRRISSRDTEFGGMPSNTVGPWSLKNDITPNDNGFSLLQSATKNNLRHVGSHFRVSDSKRWTWRHPRYRTRSVLDHVLLPASQLSYVSRCFTPADFELSSDHRPVICELNFRPKTSSNALKKPIPLELSLLQEKVVSEAYQASTNEALKDIDSASVPSETLADQIRSVIVDSAQNTIPTKAKGGKYPAEFTANTIELIEKKRRMWKLRQKSGKRITRSMQEEYRVLCRQTKRAIKADRNAKLELEASELSKTFAQDTFKGYALLKRQHRTRTKAVLPPEADFTKHYSSHYEPGDETPLSVAGCDLPESTSDNTLSRDDFDKGIQSMNSGRAAGSDHVAPELIKHAGSTLLNLLFVLMQRIWTFSSELPLIDRLGSLLPIPKKAGGTNVSCFRPICLLTSFYKLYAILVFHKVRDRVKNFVSWTQAGFIRGRSCGNNLWILRRVAERAIEFNTPVYCLLVDYKGAFDALNRHSLARVLSLFLSPSMVRRIMCLYLDAKANVRIGDVCGPAFPLLRGVRQGCPASPSFFTVALAFVSWCFRVTFVGIKLVSFHLASIEYADDQIIFTLTPDGLQEMMTFLADTALPLGLRLAPQKCELICFHRPGSINKKNLPVIQLGDTIVPWKSSVVYLGSRFSEDGRTLSAIKHRICCAESVVTRLNTRIFRRKAVHHHLKGLFVQSAVFASLTYGLQYCAVGKRDRRCLDGYYLRLIKRICLLPHDYHLSYEEAVVRSGVERPSLKLARERLRWTGHALRAEEPVLREVLTFVPEGGSRGRGRPRLRFYDTVKQDMRDRSIDVQHRTQQDFWEALGLLASDRSTWRKEIVNYSGS